MIYFWSFKGHEYDFLYVVLIVLIVSIVVSTIYEVIKRNKK